MTETRYDVSGEDGDTWTFYFEVDEGTAWNVYEVLGSDQDYYTVAAQYTDANDVNRYAEPVSGMGVKAAPVTDAEPGSVTTLTNTRRQVELTVQKNTDITDEEFAAMSDEEKDSMFFTFTLKLTAGSDDAPYNLPDDYTQLQSGSLKKIGEGLYEWTMKATPYVSEVFILPAGVRYEVTESPTVGWTLFKSQYTRGRLTDNAEASFWNSNSDLLKVTKTWVGDSAGQVVFGTRPTGWASLGIVVTTLDTATRWKITGNRTDVYSSGSYWSSVNAAFVDAQTATLEVLYQNGSSYPYKYVKLVTVTAEAPMTGFSEGIYVIDQINDTMYTVFPVENVPFEKTYTTPDRFIEDDSAGGWLYEFNIPEGETVLTVEETNVPDYYQKVEEVVTDEETGETSYHITNTLDTRDLVISKQTVDNVFGEFRFGIKFWVETTTSTRHPVKVGHCQIINQADASGQPVYDFEFFVEPGVTTASGDSIAGLYILHYDTGTGECEMLSSSPLSGSRSITAQEALGILLQLIGDGLTVGDDDSEFSRYSSTSLTMEDFGLTWYGLTDETVYVDQSADVVSNMTANGRRIDWYIIPTPAEGEAITIRTPYTLPEASRPSELEAAASVDDAGTYYFNLDNGASITFSVLPVGVSYGAVEDMQAGWTLVSRVNDEAALTDGVTDVWLFNNTEYDTCAEALAAAKAAVTENKEDGSFSFNLLSAYKTRAEAQNPGGGGEGGSGDHHKAAV